MQNRWFKISLFLLFWLFLAGVLAVSFTPFNNHYPLKGAVLLKEAPKITLKNWFNNEFQQNYEKYVNDNIGFRPWMVRLRNQIAWTFFDRAYAADVIRGVDNYLYELNYIRAYNGLDYLGYDSIAYRVRQIRTLQDILTDKGKTLLVGLAPGKGSFYPEYFPENMKAIPTDSTNYHVYARLLQQNNVNLLDFNRWFLDMKNSEDCILYPKYGIHWSYYGMLLATDSLIKRVEKLRQVKMPHILTGEIKHSKKLDRMDYDIADGMNLIFQLPTQPLCYPEFTWEDETNKVKPRVLVIADSFYWSMFNIGLWTKSFSPGGFWFYNREVYPESFTGQLLVENVNRRQILEETDVVFLLVTEANLPRFPWGFTEDALKVTDPNYSAIEAEERYEAERVKQELQIHIRNIRANKTWLEDIKRKARENNISVDSMLVLDAMWMMEYKKQKAQEEAEKQK